MTTSPGRILRWFRRLVSRVGGPTGGRPDATTVGTATSATGTDEDALAVSVPADWGDVPGWVLVTLMTAGLVSALWLVAGKALVNLFETAISHVAP
ncbi:hypothetical protein [Cellulomonas sp. NTE-D12]|uniref:hypothetical protein n=1 Tax=Cellulomonas sp. NTE-D12 TaxID=2962632 RepID=UPI003081B7B5|nr:hypothetical protein CELD12_11040 [Cellulomonas sp. NTE-D12]